MNQQPRLKQQVPAKKENPNRMTGLSSAAHIRNVGLMKSSSTIRGVGLKPSYHH